MRCNNLKKTQGNTEKEINEGMQKLQAALLEKFGGGETGWHCLLNLEEKDLRNMAIALIKGDSTWKEALRKLANVIEKNEAHSLS